MTLFSQNLLGFALIWWLLIAAVAIVAGIAIAKITFRPDDWYLRRGICPECDARKSLLHCPVSNDRLSLTCDQCGSVWLVEALIEQPIAPLTPAPIEYYVNLETHNPVMKTAFGEIEIRLDDMFLADFAGVQTPRDLLKRWHEIGGPVHRIELKPGFRSGTVEKDVETFLISAGIEPKERTE